MKKTICFTLALMGIVGSWAACGGGGSGSLDCAWASGDNCWKDSLAAALACLPADTEHGTFNADRSECTYADGIVVEFAEPAGDVEYDVEVVVDGETCAHYQELADGLRLTTSIGTFEIDAISLTDLTFHCPDGSQVHSSNYGELLACEDALDILPVTTTYGQPVDGMDLHGGPGNQAVTLFYCSD